MCPIIQICLKEQPSLGEIDKIIIEDDSSEENEACKYAKVDTSSTKPHIVSVDSDSDNSMSFGVLESPPVHLREKFCETNIEINFSTVNDVAEQVLLQGLDALASVAH